MIGIVVLETRWAYKKYNKIIKGISLVFILQLKFQDLSLQLAAPHGMSFAVAYNVCFITMTGDPSSKKSHLSSRSNVRK